MYLKNRLVAIFVVAILSIGMAVLIWANQTGKITIWGDGPEDPKPEVNLGLPITIDGTLSKDGDYFVITKNKQLDYSVYILNSEDAKASLENFLDNKVSVYGSLGGIDSNQLFAFWVNGKTIYEESVGRFVFKEKLAQSVNQVMNSFSETQKICMNNTVSNAELESFLSGSVNNLSKEQIDQINTCMNK